jgi:MFS family permease
MKLMAVFRVLSVVVALVLGALVFHAGEPNHLRWWMGALPFTLWAIGPVIAPCLIAKHGSRRWFSITMFLYFVVSSIFSGLAYYDAFFRSKSSTAALVMVFIPLYQWLGLALLLFICLGIRRSGRSVEKSREVRSGSAIKS